MAQRSQTNPPEAVRQLHLLLVESNPADSYLTVEALKQAGSKQAVLVLDDSQRALDYLFHEGGAPDLILLDLNIAPVSGLDTLAAIRASPRCACIPVVIMSGSESRDDIRNAYLNGANCYITKPTNLEQFLRFMKTCYDFWSSVVTLPPKSDHSTGGSEK